MPGQKIAVDVPYKKPRVSIAGHLLDAWQGKTPTNDGKLAGSRLCFSPFEYLRQPGFHPQQFRARIVRNRRGGDD